MKHILIYAGIVLLLSGFWYAKNILNFGNPVYPLFSDSYFMGAVHSATSIKTTPSNFAIFPFLVFASKFSSEKETASRLIIFGYFLILYLLILAFLIFKNLRKKLGWLEIMMFLFIEIYLGFMFILSYQIRFMLPAAILAPILIVLLADKLYLTIKSALSEIVYKKLLACSLVLVSLVFFIFFLGNFHYFYVKYLYELGYYKTEKAYILDIGGQ